MVKGEEKSQPHDVLQLLRLPLSPVITDDDRHNDDKTPLDHNTYMPPGLTLGRIH